MVAQRSLGAPGPDPDFDIDQPESLMRTGDAAALVPVAARDGSGTRLRRRARVAGDGAPRRPSRHGGWRPQPEADPRFPQRLSRLAGGLLALIVVAGLAFTVVRSNNETVADATAPPDVPPPAETAAAVDAGAPAAPDAATPRAADPSAPAIPAPPLDPVATSSTAEPGAAPAASAASPVPFNATPAVDAPSAPVAAPASADAPPLSTTPFQGPDPLTGTVPVAAPATPIVEPFAGYALAAALVDWPGTVVYTVQSGDLLGSIALNNRTTSAAIAGLNGLTDASHLLAGERLLIPVAYVDPVELASVTPAAALLGWTRVPDYTVREGDSLAALAQAFFTSEQAIVLLNALPPSAAPIVGERLRIPWGFTLDVDGIGSLFTP